MCPEPRPSGPSVRPGWWHSPGTASLKPWRAIGAAVTLPTPLRRGGSQPRLRNHRWRSALRPRSAEARLRGVTAWHSLCDFCGWYFCVHLGFSDELTAYQLGQSDAKLVRDLYGHGPRDALARLKR